jgi:hypothetical protein
MRFISNDGNGVDLAQPYPILLTRFVRMAAAVSGLDFSPDGDLLLVAADEVS